MREQAQLDREGFALVRGAVGPRDLDALRRAVAPLLDPGPAGVRGLAAQVPAIRDLAALTARALVEPVLGPGARLVRSILFSKGPEANWPVPWHQDLTIAVAARAELEGYRHWSVKGGVVHVEAPVELLEAMLTVRLHLDAADAANGALWLAPGSHRLGRVAATEAGAVAERLGPTLCAVEAGDALLLRPLLLHASRRGTAQRPRRVVHLEYAAVALPPLALRSSTAAWEKQLMVPSRCKWSFALLLACSALACGPTVIESNDPPRFVTDEDRACTSDEECVLVQAECCGCRNATGRNTAIAASRSEVVAARWVEVCRPTIICLTSVSDDPSCEVTETACVAGRCELIR